MLPSLDPVRDGVAGFGIELARRSKRDGVETIFLAPAAGPAIETDVGGAAAHAIPGSPTSWLAALGDWGADRVLLHYVGFGYAADACPEWLRAALAAWKRASAEHRLHIFFHELATEEPWWKRTHWTQPRQRRIIGDLVRLADRVATNCRYFQLQLTETFGAKAERLIVTPSPANLVTDGAENTDRVDTRSEGLTALVFGLPETRRRALAAHRRLLKHMIKTGKLTRLLLAGHGARREEAAGFNGAAVETKVDVTPLEFAEVARQADFGLVWNWASILTKSGVFANLCARGVPSIIARVAGDARSELPWKPMIECDDGGDVVATASAMADPAMRATLRKNAQELSARVLGWDVVASQLDRHFGA